MKLTGLLATVAVTATLATTAAHADIIADFNGNAVGGVTPVANTWQHYQLSFTATNSLTTVGFLIRNDPSYMGLDNISVTHGNGTTNLLTNGDLETGPSATSGIAPSGWYVIGTQGLQAAGRLVSDGSLAAQSGSAFWHDGAVGGHDGLAQDVATTVGETYNLSFWLESNPAPNGSTVDYQVLAGALPTGVTVLSGTSDANPVSEPISVGLLGSGLVGLGIVRRKQSRQQGTHALV